MDQLKASKLIPSNSTFLYGPVVEVKKVRMPKHAPKKSLISSEDHEFIYELVKKQRYGLILCLVFCMKCCCYCISYSILCCVLFGRNFSVVGPTSRVDRKFFQRILLKNMWFDCQVITGCISTLYIYIYICGLLFIVLFDC